GPAPDTLDRDALPSRPYRSCRLAVRALWAAAADEPDDQSILSQYLAEPRRARCQALPRLLSAQWARWRHDGARYHARSRLSQDGDRPSTDIPAAGGRRRAADRGTHVLRARRRWPRARADHALLRARQAIPGRRPGAGEDITQCQCVGRRSGWRSAWPLLAFPDVAQSSAAGGCAGAARPSAAVPRL